MCAPTWQFPHSLASSSRSQPVLDDSSGKSGAKFYQSYDKLFIIKTLTSEEVERMHSFLKHYHPVSSIGNIGTNDVLFLTEQCKCNNIKMRYCDVTVTLV